MGELTIEVYPGCYVEVVDRDALQRNPLRQNPLVAFKRLSCGLPHTAANGLEFKLLDVCIRCDQQAFGPLCDQHRDQLTEAP